MHQEYVTSLYYECNVQNMFLFCLKTTKQIQNYFFKKKSIGMLNILKLCY
jgi:hypothetical protein